MAAPPQSSPTRVPRINIEAPHDAAGAETHAVSSSSFHPGHRRSASIPPGPLDGRLHPSDEDDALPGEITPRGTVFVHTPQGRRRAHIPIIPDSVKARMKASLSGMTTLLTVTTFLAGFTFSAITYIPNGPDPQLNNYQLAVYVTLNLLLGAVILFTTGTVLLSALTLEHVDKSATELPPSIRWWFGLGAGFFIAGLGSFFWILISLASLYADAFGNPTLKAEYVIIPGSAVLSVLLLTLRLLGR